MPGLSKKEINFESQLKKSCLRLWFAPECLPEIMENKYIFPCKFQGELRSYNSLYSASVVTVLGAWFSPRLCIHNSTADMNCLWGPAWQTA